MNDETIRSSSSRNTVKTEASVSERQRMILRLVVATTWPPGARSAPRRSLKRPDRSLVGDHPQ